MDNKIKALADFLEKPVKNLRDNGENYFQVVDGFEYLVLTDEEANEKARECIEDSLWAFNAEFILEACGLDSSSNVVHSLSEMQGALYECCNDFIRALVEGTCGMDTFVKAAIESDGREHFLDTYDDVENEQDGYFIYCVG